MKQSFDFQTIIMTLQQFWANQGCLIWQPYYTQVGAGTYNPATFLRVLGPEPWHVGYVEPSVRPDDGRYGENPNRLQQHTQFQVILKPDPGNPQEIYLRSLQALGIDPREHDIRFVEDNWESPALGAWGLGWEVWLDGQEITQFTYFQQGGGIVLEPVSVEITYGLERIAMTLQNVHNFRDIRWSPERTYGDVHLQGEQEHSKYYFEVADVERTRKMYQLFEAEALSALEQGLVLPAHDYVLKCSHTFNILDTRGAVGVTERAALFARMRDLSSRVARAYLEQRKNLEFPWLPANGGEEVVSKPQPLFTSKTLADLPTKPADFLFEIGTEELPAADLNSVLTQLKERVPALLSELRLTYGEITVAGTPRRLTVMVKNLSGSQPDRESLVKGPPASRAFDEQGKVTKAGEGFARSRGLDPSQLQVAEIDGGQYVMARVFEKGQPSVAVLSEALPGLIASLHFDKTMRWNASGIAFSRPIRWLLALFGNTVIPFTYAGLLSGDSTRGLRFRNPETLTVDGIPAYLAFLRSQGIVLDPAERSHSILEQTQKIIIESGGDPQQVDIDLLEEVTNLVEAPTALRGSFDPAHLRLPADVLVSVMKKHQRYFPIYRADGGLMPYFVVVRNGDGQALDVVADGNEQVVRARFADANFFISEDIQQKLADFLPRLGTLTFQVKLGSMLDKTHRIEKLVEALLPMVKMDAEDVQIARRTAQLCKADLVTHMVIEMTSLAGIMGRYYAERSGEPTGVPEAIFEANLPRYMGDATPKTTAGLVVGMADRLDTLASLFSAGLMPSGTKDPFAQRRAALGLVQNLIIWELDFDLQAGLAAAAQGLPIPAPAENIQACLEFIVARLQSHLLDQGYHHDVVQAVLAEQGRSPFAAARAIEQLSKWIDRSEWAQNLAAYSRCVRITRNQATTFEINPAAFEDDMEKTLLNALQHAENGTHQAGSVDGFMAAFVPMVPVINQFFEKVLVMAEDPVVRANRLGLLQRIAALSSGVADFSRLEGF